LLGRLKEGHQLTFGDVVVSDQFVVLRRRAWLRSSETVSYPWSKVQIWSADGSFFIGAVDDKQAYGSIPYLHVWNTHILEDVVKTAFNKGFANRLSETLTS
jgi:hypothetical protein